LERGEKIMAETREATAAAYVRQRANYNTETQYSESSGEFDVEILADLIEEGYQGNELLKKFKIYRNNIPQAWQMLMKEISSEGEPVAIPFNELFGSEDNEENDK
jgi:hypothetical protein